MHFFVGGTRSGKSALAQRWVEQYATGDAGCLLFLATCRVEDSEMRARVALHRANRGPAWFLCEEALDPLGALHTALARHDNRLKAILLDCVSLWIANLLAEGMGNAAIAKRVGALADGMAICGLPCALVSAEVGMGIVPASALGRQYRDILGEANQIIAQTCDSLIFATCGQPLIVKGQL